MGLSDHQRTLTGPAPVLGDFNGVLQPEETAGIRPPLEREYTEFGDACAFLSLKDAPSTGCTYTWSGRHTNSKIDRVMVNEQWFENNFFCRTDFYLVGYIRIIRLAFQHYLIKLKGSRPHSAFLIIGLLILPSRRCLRVTGRLERRKSIIKPNYIRCCFNYSRRLKLSILMSLAI